MKATRILHEKTRFLRGRRECHVNLQWKWRPHAFYMKKHNDFSGVGGSGTQIYSQDEAKAHFTWENTTISPGLWGVTFKFTVKMKPRRILHEKTQGFFWGWREWHLNLQSKWSLDAFYMRKHNDFSGGCGEWHFKFIIKMKPRRILQEKTQRFLRGRWRIEKGVYINKEQRLN